MSFPSVFPEPNNHRVGAEALEIGPNAGMHLEGAAQELLPDAARRVKQALGIEVRPAPESPGAALVLRRLAPADVEMANRFFHRDYALERLREGAHFLRVDARRAEIAALSAEGFQCALATLAQLAAARPRPDGMMVREALVLDYPRVELRGVRLPRMDRVEAAGRLLQAMARLKYNTLFVDPGDCERPELERACADCGIRLLPDSGVPADALVDFDGPSILDWEHRSRRAGFPGAVVSLHGEVSVEQMARRGFLFNLVYSSWPLWNADYDNFGWEKVVDPAFEHTRQLHRFMADEAAPSGGPDPDIYQVEVAQGEGRLARVGSRADSVIFRHAVAADGPEDRVDTGAEAVGCYTIRYERGSSCEIPLIANFNIGREDIRCGRRYDPWRKAFDTDRRLRSLCCRTRLVRRIGDDGRLRVAFDFEWTNPLPEEPIREISLTSARRTDAPRVLCSSIQVVRGAR